MMTDELLYWLAQACMVVGAITLLVMSIWIIAGIVGYIFNFIKMIIMFRSKIFWGLFIFTAIAGLLGYTADIFWMKPVFLVCFAFLVLVMLIIFVIGIINSVKEKSYGIAIAGSIALAAAIGWGVWMLTDIYNNGWAY